MLDESPIAARPALRDALRSTTAGVHARLDAALSESSLSRRADYLAFLKATRAVLAPMELALSCCVLPWRYAPRCAALDADLRALATVPPPVELHLAAHVVDTASALGCVYVLEGSRLGGQVLARRLSARLAPADCQFGYLAEDRTGLQRWPAFVQCLDDWGTTASAAEWQRVKSAALSTFLRFAEAFAQRGLTQ